MTLKTRLGNLGNILDEDESQCRLLQLDSPVLSNAEFEAMRAYMARRRPTSTAPSTPTLAATDGAARRPRADPARGRGRRARRLRPRGAERQGASAPTRADPDDPGDRRRSTPT